MTEQEKLIIETFKEGLTYNEIQLKCGNPSKKKIKNTIKEFLPEVYEFIMDTNKLNRWRDEQFDNYLNEE